MIQLYSLSADFEIFFVHVQFFAVVMHAFMLDNTHPIRTYLVLSWLTKCLRFLRSANAI